MLTRRGCGQTQEAGTAGALLSPPWKGNEVTSQSAGNEAAQPSLTACFITPNNILIMYTDLYTIRELIAASKSSTQSRHICKLLRLAVVCLLFMSVLWTTSGVTFTGVLFEERPTAL